MARNITAVYRTHAVADLVRQELVASGVSDMDIHVIPNRADADTTNYQDYDDNLHDLHLPEDDLRTYQHCVRQGDFVVSVDADHDDEQETARIQQIMRRPEDEAYRLDDRDTAYVDQPLYPHSDPARVNPSADVLARRDPAYTDPYVRSYRRGSL